MNDLIHWRPQLLPETLVSVSAHQNRARITGFIFLGVFLIAVVIPFLIPLVFLMLIPLLYFGWQAKKSAPSLEVIGQALALDYRPEVPERFVWEVLPQLSSHADSSVTEQGYLHGRVGSPGPVDVQLGYLRVETRYRDKTNISELVIADAAVRMPVSFLSVQPRSLIQRLDQGAKAWRSFKESVPTQEIATESADFDAKWKVLIHQDDDPLVALRMFTPEIIMAMLDHRVPLTRGLVYRDGRISFVDLQDPVFSARQIDHLLYTAMQTTRFARLLAHEAGLSQQG